MGGKVRPWLGWQVVTPCQGRDPQNLGSLREAVLVNWLIASLTISILTHNIAFHLSSLREKQDWNLSDGVITEPQLIWIDLIGLIRLNFDWMIDLFGW